MESTLSGSIPAGQAGDLLDGRLLALIAGDSLHGQCTTAAAVGLMALAGN